MASDDPTGPLGPPEDGATIALEHPNGWAAYDTLGQFLAEDEWHPQPIDGTTAYRSGFNGRNGRFRVVAHVNVELEQLYVYVIADVNVPTDTRLPVAELMTRANYGMRIGNFELDLADGEIRYKSSIDFEGEMLTAQLISNAIYPAVTTIDRYLPAILRVAYGSVSPAEAIGEVEGLPPSPPEGS